MTPRPLAAFLVLSLLAPVDAWDHRVESAIQTLRRPALEWAMHALTDACNPTTASATLLAIAAFGGPAGAATARFALAVLVPTNLAVEGLKRATFRARPDGEHKRSNAAFPSSHAANAFAFAVVFARRWRRFAPGFYVAAALVAWSRLYLNRHFPTDVLVGALIGFGFAWLLARVWDARARAALPTASGT